MVETSYCVNIESGYIFNNLEKLNLYFDKNEIEETFLFSSDVLKTKNYAVEFEFKSKKDKFLDMKGFSFVKGNSEEDVRNDLKEEILGLSKIFGIQDLNESSSFIKIHSY